LVKGSGLNVLVRRKGLVCIFFRKCAEENNWSNQCSHWLQQYATGILRLNLSSPYFDA